MIGIDVLKKEWKERPDARPAILLVVNAFLKRMRSDKEGKEWVEPSSPVELKKIREQMRSGDESTLREFFVTIKQDQSESLVCINSLEKELGITSHLKDSIQVSTSTSMLFMVYDSYFRAFTPDVVKQADRELRDVENKLTLLRPNWTIEEKIIFPDERNGPIDPLEYDRTSWTWGRILLVSVNILFIVLFIVWVIINRIIKQ